MLFKKVGVTFYSDLCVRKEAQKKIKDMAKNSLGNQKFGIVLEKGLHKIRKILIFKNVK